MRIRAEAFLVFIIIGGCALFVLAYLATIPVLVTIGAILSAGGALTAAGISLHNDTQKEEPK